MTNSEINNYMNGILNGLTNEEMDEDARIDALYTEIEDAVVYIAQMEVDNDELRLDIDSIDIDVDHQTAVVTMSNDTLQVIVDYNHNLNAYDVEYIPSNC